MENQTMNRKQLYALACVFLFAPLVSLDSQLSDEEKKFVAGYKKFGNFIILTLGIILGIYLLNSLILKDFLLGKIVNYLFLVPLGLIIFGAIKIFENKQILNETKKITDSTNSVIQNNKSLISDMLIGYNLYEFSKNPASSYYKKEGVFYSLLIIIFGILAYFHFPKILIGVVFFFWLFRTICLVAGLDFFPQKVKNFISGLFDNNIEQIFAYPKALFLKALTFLQHKNISLIQLVDFGKTQYSQNGYFYNLQDGKKIYNNFLILEYFFFGLVLFFYGLNYYNYQKYEILALLYVLPLLFILVRSLSCYYFKSLPHIPVFFELTNFLFWLSKKRQKEKLPTNEA